MSDRLSTVHDAVRESSLEDRKDGKSLVVASIKIDPDVKDAASKICEMNGSNFSSFLRWCSILLVKDYKVVDLPVGRED